LESISEEIKKKDLYSRKLAELEGLKKRLDIKGISKAIFEKISIEMAEVFPEVEVENKNLMRIKTLQLREPWLAQKLVNFGS